MTQSETGCCPKFNPEPWDEKEHLWQNKKFVKGHVTSFFHMPLNFGSVIVRLIKQVESAKAEEKEMLCLSDEKSLFGSDIFMAVSKEVPNAINYEISGTFISKAFEGQYKDIGKYIGQMKTFVASKGKTIKRLLFWYTTCPKCAKHYGKNYIVIFAEV
jgi:effector-binding domain-containing protein